MNKQSANDCSGVNEVCLPCQRCQLCPSSHVCPLETLALHWLCQHSLHAWLTSQMMQSLIQSWAGISPGHLLAEASCYLPAQFSQPSSQWLISIPLFSFQKIFASILSYYNSLISSPCPFPSTRCTRFHQVLSDFFFLVILSHGVLLLKKNISGKHKVL